MREKTPSPPAPEPKPAPVTPPPEPPPQTRAPMDVRWLTDLGVAYFRQRQFYEAYLCFSRAAEQGFAAAQFCVAVCHLNGQGTVPDETAALLWLRKAAAQGDANAEFTLGMAYRLGRGVAADADLARQWLQQAAGHGHGEAIKYVSEANGKVGSPKRTMTALSSPAAPSREVRPVMPRQVLQRLLLGLFRRG
ncbi:MAG TPA: tetratricopeptide repeat protein [Candidatus Acidoferrales bacterium]|nr:tetratricopeptide repeat protein [Candidatus Acidoferrales bacterium]